MKFEKKYNQFFLLRIYIILNSNNNNINAIVSNNIIT